MIPFKKISRVPVAPICLYVTTAHICCDLYVIMCVEKIIKPVFKLRQMLGGAGSYGVKNQSNMEKKIKTALKNTTMCMYNINYVGFFLFNGQLLKLNGKKQENRECVSAWENECIYERGRTEAVRQNDAIIPAVAALTREPRGRRLASKRSRGAPAARGPSGARPQRERKRRRPAGRGRSGRPGTLGPGEGARRRRPRRRRAGRPRGSWEPPPRQTRGETTWGFHVQRVSTPSSRGTVIPTGRSPNLPADRKCGKRRPREPWENHRSPAPEMGGGAPETVGPRRSEVGHPDRREL